MPTGVTWQFSPASVALTSGGTASSTLTLNSTAATPGGSFPLVVTGALQASGYQKTADFSLGTQVTTFVVDSVTGSGIVHNNGVTGTVTNNVPANNAPAYTTCSAPAGSDLSCTLSSSPSGAVTVLLTAPNGTAHGTYQLGLGTADNPTSVTLHALVEDYVGPLGIFAPNPVADQYFGATLSGDFSNCYVNADCNVYISADGTGSFDAYGYFEDPSAISAQVKADAGTWQVYVDFCNETLAPGDTEVPCAAGPAALTIPALACSAVVSADGRLPAIGGAGGFGSRPNDDACSTCPLSGVTPFQPDSYPLNSAGLTATTQAALTCLKQAVAGAGGSLTVTSAFRPQEYQNHLIDVWTKYSEIGQLNSSLCSSAIANIQGEMSLHKLRYRPASVSNHSSGKAFDANWSPTSLAIDTLAWGCGFSRCVSGDPVHFCSPQ